MKMFDKYSNNMIMKKGFPDLHLGFGRFKTQNVDES